MLRAEMLVILKRIDCWAGQSGEGAMGHSKMGQSYEIARVNYELC